MSEETRLCLNVIAMYCTRKKLCGYTY